jgi:carboxypeptidase Taq
MSELYQQYQEEFAQIADLENALSVLHWDQEVNAPPKGAASRSRQIATLSGLIHQRITNPKVGSMLESLKAGNSLDEKQRRNIEESWKDFKRKQKCPTEFVEKMSMARSEAFNSWAEARSKKDFSIFESSLEKLIGLKIQEAEYLGYEEHPYDALMDEFEPEAKTAQIKDLFAGVRKELVDYVKKISEAIQVDDSFLYGNYPKSKQWDFGIDVLKNIGYDFDAGRQDISPHPFSISFGSRDVRVTTRIDESNIKDMIWSCIHEGGHALYEQGLPEDQYGLPSSESVSLGIHESQSRLWENHVGRSLSFWKAHYAQLQSVFPEHLGEISLDQFYRAINKVEPSFIRTEADELTYHFHVMVRFEIELALMEKQIKVADLPAVWNDRYKSYLGIDVPDDAQGVLQDVHWSHGSFGYFPTYSLGSFYAAQFFEKATQEIPGLEDQIAGGDSSALLSWLRDKVHRHGRQYSSDQLCQRISGESLNFDYFMRYARNKYNSIYGLG